LKDISHKEKPNRAMSLIPKCLKPTKKLCPLHPQFDHLFQILPNPGLILLPDAPKFTIIAVNKATLESTNSLEEDLIGKGIFEAFPENPEDKVSNGVENLRNSLNLVIAKKDPATIPFQKYDIPIRGTTKFEVKYANIQIIPIKDDKNNITHILQSVEDVTDKKNIESLLKTERQRFNDLYLNAPFCMGILKGTNHVYEMANNSYLELINKRNIIGKSVKELLPESEDQGLNEILDKVYKTGSAFSAKEMLIKFDKEGKGTILEIYMDVLLQPHIEINGNIDGVFFFIIDVTEKVVSRKKIEASEKSLKESQEVGNLGNWKFNFAAGISIWSDELCRIYGLLPSDNIHSYEKWLSFIHPEDLNELRGNIKESQKTLCDFSLNFRIVLEDGTAKHIYGKSKYTFNKTGEPEGIYGIALDVTELIKSKEKVRSQSNLLNNITQAAISTNAFGTINFWNTAATEIYGWTAEEALGKNVISLISTEQKEIEITDIMEKLSLGNSSKEFVVKHKDGHTFSVFTSISPIYDKQEKFEGTIEVSMDITGRKKEEKKLRKLYKELSDYKYALDESSIVAITDQKGIIKHVNNNFCKISQYSPGELIGQDYQITNSGYHSDDNLKHIFENISKGEIWKGELKNNAKDGTTYWVDTIITPFLDEGGKPYQYVVIQLDITEIKKAEENIKKQNEELQFQNREKENRAAELSLSNKELVKTNIELDRFVYSVSHDLRFPLTSILGLISFIEEDSREPDTLEQVKMIRASINRLDGFIKNILSYSQNNRIGLETRKIPTKKSIVEIVNSVRNIKGAKGISFQIDIDEQQAFYSDWQRFNTILENLISNGIKYHTEAVSGRYLKLTGTSNHKELKLRISDNGIGIDAAYHEKIFDMFYRLSGKTPGSGFGLYIVKETLEKMHGKIEVQSEKGVGTTFIITLKNLKKGNEHYVNTLEKSIKI